MKKRILSLLCLTVLLVGMLLPGMALAEKTRYVYTSNGKALNLRSEPKTHTENVIAHIPFGAKVKVLNHIGHIEWSYVSYDGHKGYVLNRYLVDKKPNTPKPAPTKAPDPTPAPASITDTLATVFSGMITTPAYDVQVHASTPGGHVNLRWAPTKKAPVQARIADGTLLRVIAQNTNWAQVVNPQDGTTGFMMLSFLNALTPEEG